MRITTNQLRKIIREEAARALREAPEAEQDKEAIVQNMLKAASIFKQIGQLAAAGSQLESQAKGYKNDNTPKGSAENAAKTASMYIQNIDTMSKALEAAREALQAAAGGK